MHFRVEEEARITTLLPISSVHDVSKVFFTIEDFALWDRVVKNQVLYEPPEHLVEEYKQAFLGGRFVEAFKCRLLLKVIDENYDHLPHFMRLLFAP